MKLWKKTLICLSLMIFLTIGYLYAGELIERKKDVEYLIEDDYSILFQIDDAENSHDVLQMRGWAFLLGKDSTDDDIEVYLYNERDNEIIYLNNTSVIRDDVNEYFRCQYDYSKSGFETRINSRKLDLNHKYYQVLLAVKETKKIYKTSTYITNEGLLNIKPDERTLLNVAGTDLETTVKEGVLLVDRPDIGLYVYQHGGDLFWIADKSFYFEDDNRTWLEFHLTTTQIEKLPQERLDNEHYWDNLRFVFEDAEDTTKDYGHYRVAVTKLPTEYSIARVWIGYHVNDWIWRNDFRIRYDFR